MIRIALALAFGVGAPALAAAPSGSTTVVLVRHAEKRLDQGDDPSLTPAGVARAEALATVARAAGVTAVYVTHYRRTQETAAPAVRATGVKPTEVRVDDVGAHVTEMARRLRAGPPGSTALVVGHSETLPAMLAALGVTAKLPGGSATYDDLLVVVLDSPDRARFVHARYGEKPAR